MKKLIKIVITTICLVIVTACGAKNELVNLEKDGTIYNTDDGVSFYYPNDYSINTNVMETNIVEFSKDNDTLYFKVIDDEFDNVVDDKDELYIGELEQSGVSEVEVSKPVIESGNDVYEYIFVYQDTGIKSKEIVYFSEEHTYIYGYRATEADFDNNEEDMTVYLHSFSFASGK